MITTLIQPKLGLSKKTDAALLEYANNIITSLDLHAASFPGADIAGLKTSRDTYTAKLAVVKNGTPSQTVAKNNARTVLENNLKSVANDCAEIADGNEEIFLRSGYEIKSKPTPSGMLPSPKIIDLSVGSMEGTLMFQFKGVPNANAYEVNYGLFSTEPDTWTMLSVTTAGKNLIGELKSNEKYSVRVRAVGTKGKKGIWSDIITVKTY